MSKPSTIGRACNSRAFGVIGVILAGSVLSGCYAPKDTVGYPNDYRKRHQIALRDGSRTVEVLIGQSRGSLTPTQRAEVLAFAKVWKNEATGGVVIDVPSGTQNQFAASRALNEINAIFSASGVPMQSVAVRHYTPDDPAQFPTVKLTYSKIVADAGPCGLWPQDLGPTMSAAYNDNLNYWNLGCSNQRNLAAMVANPADLVQPRAETPAWASRRTTVLEKYRQGESPATNYPKDNLGTVSDVGR